jgi:hypothetical protein
MAKMANSADMVTPEFRLAFANLFEMTSFNDGKPNYNMVMLFPKTMDPAEMAKLTNACYSVAVAQWGEQANWPKDKAGQPNVAFPFKDGDLEKYDGFAGMKTLSAKAYNRPPAIVDANKQPILDRNKIYSGCWCLAIIQFFAWKNQFGNCGVSASFDAVQLVREDDPFGGSSDAKAQDMFTNQSTGVDDPANYQQAAAPPTETIPGLNL